MAPFCAHCNANHNLKYTFIVTNGKEEKQVGRTCLKDYCGIDPQMIGAFNAFFEEMEEESAERYEFIDGVPCVYSAVEILAHAIEITDEQGYIKSDEYDSNKGHLIKKCGNVPNHDYFQKAEVMAEAIKNLSIDDAITYRLNNVQARLKGDYCKPSDFGYFAYAPTAYKNMIERKAREERRAQEKAEIGAHSNYVGIVGERADFEIKEVRLLTSFFTDYGTTFLYRFIDKNDNVLIWFASSKMENETASKIKATVKSHSERDGVKQTLITRVKKVA